MAEPSLVDGTNPRKAGNQLEENSRVRLAILAMPLALGAVLSVLHSDPSPGPEPGRILQGQDLDVYIGSTVGGGRDIYGWLLARHLGKHIPGSPSVVPKNMEGAGGLRLANWIYNVAPKDGTAIGTFGRGIRSIRSLAAKRPVRCQQVRLDRQHE